MTLSINPWHSRPIDVHRWSDHPEVKDLVDRIWDGFLGEAISERTRGPKPKMAFRKQLRVVILDLYVAWCRERTLRSAAVGPDLPYTLLLSAAVQLHQSSYSSIAQ